MQIFNVLPVFFMLGAAYARQHLERRDMACLQGLLGQAANQPGAPQGTGAIICYVGSSSVRSTDSSVYGQLLQSSDCGGASCFYIRGPNKWTGQGSGDNDHFALRANDDKCTYDISTVSVNCWT